MSAFSVGGSVQKVTVIVSKNDLSTIRRLWKVIRSHNLCYTFTAGCVFNWTFKPINKFFVLGSRIGVFYTLYDDTKAEMHFIINGVDQGPCVKNIPFRNGALHAVVDVYGTTKQVKIIQLYGSELLVYHEKVWKLASKQQNFTLISVSTLQSACRDVILTRITNAKVDVNHLPLPPTLKEYLLNFY